MWLTDLYFILDLLPLWPSSLPPIPDGSSFHDYPVRISQGWDILSKKHWIPEFRTITVLSLLHKLNLFSLPKPIVPQSFCRKKSPRNIFIRRYQLCQSKLNQFYLSKNLLLKYKVQKGARTKEWESTTGTKDKVTLWSSLIFSLRFSRVVMSIDNEHFY